ncbi:proclotting enzyme [Neodiprion lecontei]|uniref:Proclotting enzyme n=1 Tax=Neodiprion lecontei TaxID=441921 RepID=A0A6J0CD90_NEOLC|nr:proclotting enzyme [Neodiprion lecontei]
MRHHPAVLLLFILSVGSNCHPVEEDAATYIDPDALASLKWGPNLQGLKTLQLPVNLDHSNLRVKRTVNLGDAVREPKPNKPYQACVAPGDKKGHCRHLSMCLLDEFRSNSPRFMEYLCIIEQTYVGVCCPDGTEVGKSSTPNAESVAGILPAVASADDEDPKSNSSESIDDGLETVDPNKNVTQGSGATRTSLQPRGPRGCGVSTRSRTRIVGGRPADPQEWPWIAALLRKEASHYCGGVLITDRHVLTAAHCVFQFKAREIKVRLGEYDFRRQDETRALDFRVTEIRQHLDFDPSTYEHDIAIVKMHRPTTFSSYIWPICLPPVGVTFENKSGIVIGWGTQFFGGPASSVLMEVAVPIWPQKKCVRTFTQRIPDTAMCAAAFEGGRDSCQGDSGGPLLHQLGNGRWVNVGIVSWGIRCGEPGHPGVYTRVNRYLDWIFANAVF